MNLLKEKRRREVNITIGYAFEIFFYVSSGLFFLISGWLSFIFVVCAAIIGHWVSKQIEYNAVENFKWGL